MGEVYRARDAKLNREVAIKVLLPSVANDPDRLARFSREAQVLASLNHPNIAHIHGLEESGGVTALILELVEGEDLAQRIARGSIPIDEALPIARQIAEALEAAHDHGIIHRDLKPANIKVRPDGTVKVLDFGLAKAIDRLEGDGFSRRPADVANSPTLSIHATEAGIILGTAAYMSPEQAKGKPVDKRADVWAFGVVLYEMLTGAKAFPGEDISDTLATMLKFDPDWNLLPAETPPAIRRLLKRCLIKDPKSRLRECGTAIVEIDDATSGQSTTVADNEHAIGPPQYRWLLPAMALALIAMVAVTAWSLWGVRAPDAPQVTRRFTIALPDSHVMPPSSGTLLAMAPDGRTLIYRAGQNNGPSQLFRRPLDQFEASPIAGTESGREPLFFSPDGQWLAFRADETLKTIAMAGGPPRTLAAKTVNTRGGAWGMDGLLIFGGDAPGSSLFTIPAAGGELTPISKPDGVNRAWYPQILAGGKAVLYTLSTNAPDTGSLHVLDLASRESRQVLPNAVAGRVLPTGHLVFVRGGGLWAVPFDRDRVETTGAPVPVIEGVRVEGGGAVQYSVSDEGTLAYIPGVEVVSSMRSVVIANRDGTSEPLTAPSRDYQDLALSPDQTRLAVVIGAGMDSDVWVLEIARGTLTRVTNERGYEAGPLWSHDGASIVFASVREDKWTIERKAADGTGSPEVLAAFDKPAHVEPTSWSPDGRTLLVEVDATMVSVSAGTKEPPKPLLQSARQAVISPDGRWVAYVSRESGSAQVYLQRFPSLGERRVISGARSTYGYMPIWSRDGSELFYLSGPSRGPINAVMRASVRVDQAGMVDIGAPVLMSAFTSYTKSNAYRSFDVTRDRQRLFVISNNQAAVGDGALRRINIVTNWFEELKRLVPIR